MFICVNYCRQTGQICMIKLIPSLKLCHAHHHHNQLHLLLNAITLQTNRNSNSHEEENTTISMEELPYHHGHDQQHQEDVTTCENGVCAISIDIPHQQHLGLDMGNSYNNMDNHLVQHEIDVLPYQQSTWDPSVQEMQDMGYANHPEEHQPQIQQQLQQIEAQHCSQSYNASTILDPPYPSPDPLNLLHLPNFQNLTGFLGDLPIGSDNKSASSVLIDPLFHLNLGPQPPALRNGSVFGEGEKMEGDGSQLDMGMLDFNMGTSSVGKGREGKGTITFAAEKQRRDHLNEKYKILRSLIPNPTKIDRASVVGDAIDYIRALVRTVNELKLLVQKKRYEKESCKKQPTEDDVVESGNIKPLSDPDGCIMTSWFKRKSKDGEVHVRIIDDDVTIKLFQRENFNCLLYVSKVLDELQLEPHHVAGGRVEEYCSFLFNSKMSSGPWADSQKPLDDAWFSIVFLYGFVLVVLIGMWMIVKWILRD